ncbi:MAG: DUF4174 domain-containing protein [Pseudomonadota bacterium]
MIRPHIRSLNDLCRALPAALTAGVVALLPVIPGLAQETAVAAEAPEPMLQIMDVGEFTIQDFQWQNRLIVVFADTPADPRFNEQIELLTARPSELVERDVVVLTDTDPEARSPIRIQLRPRGFQTTLIGKDGEVELRKPAPWSSREFSRSIDKMPLRQQEIREQKAEAG